MFDFKSKQKTPIVLQMEAAECGAAALSIILGYYGKFIPLEEIRFLCGVSRDGSRASSIIKTANHFGLNATGFKLSPEDLLEQTLPVIVFWNFNHFLVLEKLTPTYAYLNDPASGRRRISYSEFLESYSNITLSFTKSDTFSKSGKKRSMFSELFSILKTNTSFLTYIFITSILLAITAILIPNFLSIFIDVILVEKETSWISHLVAAIVITSCLQALLTYLQQQQVLKLQTILSVTHSSRLFWKIIHLPSTFFDQRSKGELSLRIQSFSEISKYISEDFTRFISDSLTLVLLFLTMIVYDVSLAFISLFIGLINYAFFYVFTKKMESSSQLLAKEDDNLYGVSTSIIQSIDTIKAAGGETDSFSRWSGFFVKSHNTRNRLESSNHLFLLIPDFLIYVGQSIILVCGGIHVMNGDLSPGLLVAFMYISYNFHVPIKRFVGLGNTTKKLEASLQRLQDIYQNGHSDESSVKQDPENTQRVEGKLELRHIYFGYSSSDEPVLNDFCLYVEPGQQIALVGQSGSGKTTVSNIIVGLLKPITGQILLDGKSISTYSNSLLASSIAYVGDHSFLFEGSVKNNIAFWDSTIVDAKIIEAAKDACIHSVITSRSGGYDSIISENGSNFSGGERQRLEIARALALEPNILIFDEATTGLDSNIEEKILSNLRRRGCTVIIVSHRLSTIRDSHVILYLENGKVVESGNHDHLVQLNGKYLELINDK
ncbi:ATP-binding cassette domain-containing protein [bacterium]|jgi:NHLM bacteriocin system ABC transporter peptidase/ATP-binding protein|nr:ATP-binding cassette domain-containing protein [bacterium]